jgi:nucleoside-diphosphate-sugar epimerase
MAERELHVVFGAGQIGTPLARLLSAQGHDVRIVRRSAGRALDGIPVTSGDAGDPAFVIGATRGARVLYHCMNPLYDARVWERELPRIMQSLIAAARENGARLVVLDNLYMLGRPGSVPMNEDTEVAPVSRKGRIRARVAEMLFDAHRQGEIRAVSGRASDFYGAGGVQTLFGERFWREVFAGKPALVPMNPDFPHTWHFTLDVAAALALLGAAGDDAYGRAWMLPAAPPLSPRELIARLAAAWGHEIRVTRAPRLVLAALALFMPILRELAEMSYQWEAPFVVDDRRFRERFAMTPTPIEEGTRQTVEWAEATFKPGA